MSGPAGDKAVNKQSNCFYGAYILLRGNGGGRNIVQKALYNTTSQTLEWLLLKNGKQ